MNDTAAFRILANLRARYRAGGPLDMRDPELMQFLDLRHPMPERGARSVCIEGGCLKVTTRCDAGTLKANYQLAEPVLLHPMGLDAYPMDLTPRQAAAVIGLTIVIALVVTGVHFALRGGW